MYKFIIAVSERSHVLAETDYLTAVADYIRKADIIRLICLCTYADVPCKIGISFKIWSFIQYLVSRITVYLLCGVEFGTVVFTLYSFIRLADIGKICMAVNDTRKYRHILSFVVYLSISGQRPCRTVNKLHHIKIFVQHLKCRICTCLDGVVIEKYIISVLVYVIVETKRFADNGMLRCSHRYSYIICINGITAV